MPDNRTILVESQSGADATVTGETIDVGDYATGVAFLSVTASTGTSETLDVVAQHSADGSVWFTAATFTQATGATTETETLSNFGRYMRFVQTIGGTTPTFDYTIHLSLKN